MEACLSAPVLRVKKTTPVAWVGAKRLFLAYFDIDSAARPSHEPTRAPFTPRTPPFAHWYWMFNPGSEEVIFDPFWQPFAIFQGKCPEMHISTTSGTLHYNSFAMMFVYNKNTKTLKNMLFGAVGDRVWTSGREK